MFISKIFFIFMGASGEYVFSTFALAQTVPYDMVVKQFLAGASRTRALVPEAGWVRCRVILVMTTSSQRTNGAEQLSLTQLLL